MRRVRVPFRCARQFCVILLAFVAVSIGTTCILYNSAEHQENEYIPFANSEGKNWREQVLEVPTVLRLMDIPRNASILEIGTGRGVALTPIARLRSPHRLVGVDISAEALEVARRRLIEDNVNAELVQADARKLPFPDSSFDIIIDFGTLYHIANQTLALKEIARVLRPWGTIVSETTVAQFTSHPFRSWGRKVPWHRLPCMTRAAWWVLWEKRINACKYYG